MFKVVITDHGFASVGQEIAVLLAAGATLEVASSVEKAELRSAIRDADALLVQWARIDADLISVLERCRVIVRYGIGVDNIDLEAAKERGIAVCNVPDYGVDEVADHTMAMALSLGRQLPVLDRRLRDGAGNAGPTVPPGAFREMVFATAGFGRIARAVLDRAKGFKFRLIAYDPYVSAEVFDQADVVQVAKEELFSTADILSLHLPLTAETRHFLNEASLRRMKKNAILINAARGPLVDEAALNAALVRGEIGAAGLDVFEVEPLPADSPLRRAPNTIMSSHVAWYSARSVPTLQLKAAEEVVRGLRGEPLLHRLNP